MVKNRHPQISYELFHGQKMWGKSHYIQTFFRLRPLFAGAMCLLGNFTIDFHVTRTHPNGERIVFPSTKYTPRDWLLRDWKVCENWGDRDVEC